MNKITFSSIYDYPGQPVSTVENTTDAETLTEILKSFECFLRGAGFVFDGAIEVVDWEAELYGDASTKTAYNLEEATDLLRRIKAAYGLIIKGVKSEDTFLWQNLESFLIDMNGGAK
jgi:hypothetical protein